MHLRESTSSVTIVKKGESEVLGRGLRTIDIVLDKGLIVETKVAMVVLQT